MRCAGSRLHTLSAVTQTLLTRPARAFSEEMAKRLVSQAEEVLTWVKQELNQS